MLSILSLALATSSFAPQSVPASAEPPVASRVVDYVEDGGTKIVAEVEVRARGGAAAMAEIALRAHGLRIDADPGITGVHGANRHTGAELQDLLREGELELRLRAAGGEWRTGELRGIRWSTMPERRLWSHRAIGERTQTERRYPVEVAVGAVDLAPGEYQLALLARSVPRLVATVRLGPAGAEVVDVAGCDRFGSPMADRPQSRMVAAGARVDAGRRRAVRQDPVQDPQAKVTPLVLPRDWEQRDLEGRWVWFRADLQRRAADQNRLGQWADLLAERKEFELLELIGIYQGWPKVGPALANAGAPQWIRVGVWNVHAYNSHSKENATDMLKQHGPEVLAWFERYPAAQRGPGQAIFDQLDGEYNAGDLAADALPPLDGRALIAPYLDPPAVLERFGDRLTAEPGVVYLHQVIRALEGVGVRGRLDAMGVSKLVRLADHQMLPVRLQVFDSLASLPAEIVPWEAMRRMAADVQRDTVGRAGAVLVLRASRHPRALEALGEVAAVPGHPGWSHAVEALVVRGGPHELAQLEILLESVEELAVEQRTLLATSVERLRVALSAKELMGNNTRSADLLRATAWLERHRGEAGRERSGLVRAYLTEVLDVGSVIGLLERAIDDGAGEAASGIAADELAQLRADLRAWARSLAANGR